MTPELARQNLYLTMFEKVEVVKVNRSTIAIAAVSGFLIIHCPIGHTMPADAEACYESYEIAESLQAFSDDSRFAANYTMRKMRAGQPLSNDQRFGIVSEAFDRSLEYWDELTSAALGEGSAALTNLSGELVACDEAFGILQSARDEPSIDHLECSKRYGTLAYSFTAPQQRDYFAKRTQLAVRIDAFFLFMDVADVDKSTFDQSRADAQSRAKSIFSDGNTNYSMLISAMNDARACDRQYGLPETAIPQSIYDAAAGK